MVMTKNVLLILKIVKRINLNMVFIGIHVKYTLPETGGTGIYWYMAGGMLLMMVAAVAIYRKRYYEYMNK